MTSQRGIEILPVPNNQCHRHLRENGEQLQRETTDSLDENMRRQDTYTCLAKVMRGQRGVGPEGPEKEHGLKTYE